MDDDRYRALLKEWRRRPPAHWLIASSPFIGYKPPAESAPSEDRATAAQAPTIAALQRAFPNGRLR